MTSMIRKNVNGKLNSLELSSFSWGHNLDVIFSSGNVTCKVEKSATETIIIPLYKTS